MTNTILPDLEREFRASVQDYLLALLADFAAAFAAHDPCKAMALLGALLPVVNDTWTDPAEWDGFNAALTESFAELTARRKAVPFWGSRILVDGLTKQVLNATDEQRVSYARFAHKARGLR